MHETHNDKLLIQNKLVCRTNAKRRRIFFGRLSKQQNPQNSLWIGCSIAEFLQSITRNWPRWYIPCIGNIGKYGGTLRWICWVCLRVCSLLSWNDIIIVCGHYGCGGNRGCISNKKLWDIKQMAKKYQEVLKFYAKEIDAIEKSNER